MEPLINVWHNKRDPVRTGCICPSGLKDVVLKLCARHKENDKRNFSNLYSKLDAWHGCHGSTWPVRLLSPLGKWAEVSISQTVVRTQNSSALPTLNHCQHTFRMQASSSLRCLILSPFSSHFPPSSTPPVPHSPRSSGKFLTFVTKNKGLKKRIDCRSAGHAREACGVFGPAGPPRSLHQSPHCCAEVQPSVECLCACLPKSHEDLSLWHKFI